MAGFHKSCFCLVDWNKISGLSHDHKTSPTCAHKLIKEASSSGGGVETDVTFSTISALTLSKGTTTTVKRSWDSHCEKSSFSNWLLVCDTPDGGALTSPLWHCEGDHHGRSLRLRHLDELRYSSEFLGGWVFVQKPLVCRTAYS